jgi:hypothetical protein
MKLIISMVVFGFFFLQTISAQEFGEITVTEIPYGLQGIMQDMVVGPDGTSFAITSHTPTVSTAWSGQHI